MASSRIVIVGGGFAGVKCARTLRRKTSPERCEIVLFNRENHMVFHPLLAEVAGGSLNPDAVAAPLRQMLPGVRCRTEDVSEVMLGESTVAFEGDDGKRRTMSYDHVVLACGGAVNLGMVPGMADHAFPMKTIGDAVTLRAHVMQQLERAEVCDDAERRHWYLSFVIVGGGYSGVEAAGEIHDLALMSRRFFQNIGPDEITVSVIHSRDQLLPEIGSKLRDFARRKMERSGIKVLLGERVTLATPEGVQLASGKMVRGATVVCTIGTVMAPLLARLDVPKDKGRVLTDPDMRLRGIPNAWAAGDGAEIVNAFDGAPCPPTGQFAERQGRQCAENILRVMDRAPTRPFHFKPLGQLCSIGGHTAVAEMFGLRISGFVAWFLWRSVYLFKLPSWSRRVKVGFDWAWQLVFSRDLTHLKTDRTERVSHAFYRAGDLVFQEGDPASSFYVIERGEVEVLRKRDGAPDPETVAVLGPGDFFGEMALLSNRPRNATVRARSPLDVVVMGQNVFNQVSTCLAPLREVIARTVSRRSENLWAQLPAARSVLEHVSLAELLEPLPSDALGPDDTFERALDLFDRHGLDHSCLVDAEGCLIGVLTRTDFLRALEIGATAQARVRGFMVHDPVAVAAGDSALVAASTMREHGLKWIPVVESHETRRAVGTVRAQTIVGRVLRQTATATA